MYLYRFVIKIPDNFVSLILWILLSIGIIQNLLSGVLKLNWYYLLLSTHKHGTTTIMAKQGKLKNGRNKAKHTKLLNQKKNKIQTEKDVSKQRLKEIIKQAQKEQNTP